MSIYLYLECRSHTPPLCSDMEVGQHLYDLPEIRKHIANRALYVDLHEQDIHVDAGYFDRPAIDFLAQHPSCEIGIIDEYDDRYPVTGDDANDR